ncbi:GNAT family N-acetyltransferase [Anaerolineales bacterium HSG6]|nr:GNAT family N-acetyltransferase [Anaerolineales bacterium HSG6]
MTAKITIKIIHEQSPYLPQVIDLADENSKILGHFPRGAFTECAKNQQVLVALDEEGYFMGYLLYRIAYTKNEASITHLCVDPSFRGKGVAVTLVNYLKQTTKQHRGIKLKCRQDYEATNVWPRFGFRSIGEMPGRSKTGSTLLVWWFSHEHPTLFDTQANHLKLSVAIDFNILIDLQDERNSETLALMADWLQDEIELCVTDEIFNEISRDKDKNRRKKRRDYVNYFRKLPSNNPDFLKYSELLKPFFPQIMTSQDEADLRELARAIVADVQFFVTRDEPMLKRAESIYDEFKVRIIRPLELIRHLDELHEESNYQPSRLAGSVNLNLTPVNTDLIDDSQLANIFCNGRDGENHAEFLQRLRPCLAQPHLYETIIIKNSDKDMLALIVYGKQDNQILDIPLFRTVYNSLSKTLIRYLLLQAILRSSKEQRILTKVTDPYLSDEICEALSENKFISVDGYWVKTNLSQVATAGSFLEPLTEQDIYKQHKDYFDTMAKTLNLITSTESLQTKVGIEKSLWPAKIIDLDIPNFVISIKPEWAKDLFDENFAKQYLFGAKESLILNGENVYYRTASHTKMLDCPARVLWYVTAGKFQGSKSIRACSYIDEIVIGKPKDLFRRFRRLGVYEWRNIYELAKQDIENDIMAFRFSHTELFDKPITWERLQEIWKAELSRKFHVQSPLKITNEMFIHLYKIGMNIR